MKALIIDDEAAAITAVRLLVDWDACGINTVYEVNAPQDALPLIRSEEIQIVISDIRMPGLSGLDLITEIHRIRPNTKIIMMSGFKQFDYVRTALQKGCIDYILKPIDEKQINAAVKRALQEWQKDITQQAIEHSYHRINSQMEQKRAQKCLLLAMNNIDSQNVFQQIASILPSFADMQAWQLAQLQTLHLPEEALRGESDISLLTDMVNDIAWSTGKALAVTRRINSNIVILFDADMENAHAFLCQILNILYQKTGIRFVMGVSERHMTSEGLAQGLVEARERAKRCGLPIAGTGILHETGVSEPEWEFDFGKYEDELHRACLSGVALAMQRSAEACATEIAAQPGLCIESLEKIRNAYLHMRIRWIEGFRLSRQNTKRKLEPPDLRFRLPITVTGEFSEALLRESLMEDLVSLAEFFLETIEKKESENPIFQQVEQYILLRYTEKISLGMIAEEMCVSEGYLSRAFKKHIGMGITEYINQLRVNQAKLLLQNPQLRISDIAFRVGYTDEKYFSRVFRKLEGVSPQQYREG